MGSGNQIAGVAGGKSLSSKRCSFVSGWPDRVACSSIRPTSKLSAVSKSAVRSIEPHALSHSRLT